MADSRPIGVFDSGVGGLSTLGAILRELPRENYIYYGDMLHAPYGTKSPEEVLNCVRAVMDILLSRDVKAVVIACNTATSVAAATLRDELTLPIIGMEPALKPAAETRHGGYNLVLATPVTLRLQKFQNLMERYGEGAIPVPCPGLMDLVEKEDFDGARKYLEQVFAMYPIEQVDSVVLGCTHYSFLKPVVRSLLPENISVYDGNEGTARQLRRVLAQLDRLSDTGTGQVDLLTSNPVPDQLRVMRDLLSLSAKILS